MQVSLKEALLFMTNFCALTQSSGSQFALTWDVLSLGPLRPTSSSVLAMDLRYVALRMNSLCFHCCLISTFQYSPTGAVVRGPAPLPLALAHCDVDETGKVLFSPWTEIDFRTDAKGWWN